MIKVNGRTAIGFMYANLVEKEEGQAGGTLILLAFTVVIVLVFGIYWYSTNASASVSANNTLNAELGTYQFVVGQDVIQATANNYEIKYSGIENGKIVLTEVEANYSLLSSSSTNMVNYVSARTGNHVLLEGGTLLATVDAVNKNTGIIKLTIQKQ